MRSPRYLRYALGIIALVYVVNYLDRQILAILLPSIKSEFWLSDTALGLLAGPAFALFYAILGVPIARLADRISRRNIIAASLALFSLATFACGLAIQFAHLFLARVLTGIGEAGTGPAAQSLISDLYPPKRRASAQAFYAAGLNVGIMVAFFGGGLIAEAYGWRVAFMAAGLPGFVLAAFVLLMLHEPTRGASEEREDKGQLPALRATTAFLLSQRSYRHIVLGTAMSAFSGYGLLAFIPSFLSRSHGLSTATIGTVFALILGVGGGVATFVAGLLADRGAKRDVRWNMYVPVLGVLISLPFWPMFFLHRDTLTALLCAIIPASLASIYIGPCMAMIQGLSPLRMRATAASLQLFFANVIGLGLGPWCIGIASDVLRPSLGQDSLRYALLIGVIPAILSAVSYWLAGRSLGDDMIRAKAFDQLGKAAG
jgi:predicted MFS family arabinose efflux permease